MYSTISLHFTSGIILGSSVHDEIVYGSTLSPVEVTLHSYRFLDFPVRLKHTLMSSPFYALALTNGG